VSDKESTTVSKTDSFLEAPAERTSALRDGTPPAIDRTYRTSASCSVWSLLVSPPMASNDRTEWRMSGRQSVSQFAKGSIEGSLINEYNIGHHNLFSLPRHLSQDSETRVKERARSQSPSLSLSSELLSSGSGSLDEFGDGHHVLHHIPDVQIKPQVQHMLPLELQWLRCCETSPPSSLRSLLRTDRLGLRR
jgi:hypothetical protein